MTVRLDIPDSVIDSLRLPAHEVEPRLRMELAVALFAQRILAFGKACELAGVSRYAFAELIASRDIPRHYDEGDLASEIEYACSIPDPASTAPFSGKRD